MKTWVRTELFIVVLPWQSFSLVDVFSNPILPQSRFTNRNPILSCSWLIWNASWLVYNARPPRAPDTDEWFEDSCFSTNHWITSRHSAALLPRREIITSWKQVNGTPSNIKPWGYFLSSPINFVISFSRDTDMLKCGRTSADRKNTTPIHCACGMSSVF